MTLVNDIIQAIEDFAPPALQEDYDNAGLITGNKNNSCTGVLFALDATEAIIDEAIALGCNMVVAHHPIIFKGLKKITGANYVERTIIKTIKNDVAIYAAHTNLDNVRYGVNYKMAQKIGLTNLQILAPKKGLLNKLVVFVPAAHAEKVREALFAAGAGNIGNYSHCSFNLEGNGTFMGSSETNPFAGKPNELHTEPETRVEVIFESYLQPKILNSMRKAHPYEEVAFDVYPLLNAHPTVGSGMHGELEVELSETDFLTRLKQVFQLKTLKYTNLLGKKVKKVAICGGSGQFLLKNAIACGADSYVSADFKYHEYFDADGKILVADIGHFETEQFTPELFYEIIQKKFPKFALHLSKTNTNPINYL